MVHESKRKPVTPIQSLYREECRWWKVSAVWCHPIGLLQVVGWRGVL